MGMVQSTRSVRSGESALACGRQAAWIDNPKMDSKNPALAVFFREAPIGGIPGHEPPADRRSWGILDADFPVRSPPKSMNYSKRDREAFDFY